VFCNSFGVSLNLCLDLRRLFLTDTFIGNFEIYLFIDFFSKSILNFVGQEFLKTKNIFLLFARIANFLHSDSRKVKFDMMSFIIHYNDMKWWNLFRLNPLIAPF